MAFPYAPVCEPLGELGLRERYGLFIGGSWSAPNDGGYAACENPATETALALVARANEADVDRAVRAARRGYEKYWRKLKAPERGKYVYRLARALADEIRPLATLEALDSGLPIRHAQAAVTQAAARAFYDAGWADKLTWAIAGHERAHPLGVVGALVSTRSPLASAVGIVGRALACGNAVILKPAGATPLTALALARICEQIDLPPGVLNVVTGDAPTGTALVDQASLDLIVVEGSPSVGSAIRRATAGRGVRLHCDLEGHTNLVVFDDAPIDAAVDAIASATHRTPLRLGDATLVLVAESIAADVVARTTLRLQTLRHGDPLDWNSDVGPLATRAQRDARLARIASAVAGGASRLQSSATLPERGYWYAAEILRDAPAAFDSQAGEVGGPLVMFESFRTPDDALARASSVVRPTSASVWTCGGAQALFAAQRLAASVVWCNTFDRSDPSSPAGGAGHLRAYLDL